MKLLITGGTGFIGSQLALEARTHGHEILVTGLTNTAAESTRLQELQMAAIEVKNGSLQSLDFARSVVAGCDGVIHLAAAQHEANVPDAYFRTVNVEATRTLLQASVEAGVKRFVYGSTIGVYGAAGATAIAEDSPTGPVNIYGITKLEAEAVVNAYADRIGTTIIRISETYGPGDRRLLKLFKTIDRGIFVIIGDGLNQRQPIHVQDLVRGLLLAVQHPAAVGQTLLLAGPAPMTTRAMMDAIAGALERVPRRLSVPMGSVMLVAKAMEAAFRPLGIQPPLHRRRLDFYVKSFWFSTVKAKALLGFEAVIPFSVGARDVVNWYRNRGLLSRPQSSNLLAEGQIDSPLNNEVKADVPLATFSASRWGFADILEYTHDAIIIWEMDGVGIVYWNRAAEQLYGYSRQEAHGRTTHVLLNTHIEGGVDQLEGKLARYGVWVGNLRHRRRDGASVKVQARLALMSQNNGRWLVLEVNRDITSTQELDENSQRQMESHLAAWNAAADTNPGS